MNVCFFNSEKYWGGGEKWHYKMAEYFKADGYSVTICTSKGSELADKAKENNISVQEFNISKFSFLNPLKIFSLYRFFKKNNINAVFMNNPFDLKMCSIAAKLAKVANIIYRRGMPHNIKNTFYNRWLFGKVITNLIVISKEIERSIYANNPNMIDHKKVVLLYNAIDSKDYNPVDKKPEESIVFGTTGRLVEQKGLHHLINAAKILNKKGYNFKILIAGKGPLEKSLSESIKYSGLSKKIELVGFIKDLTSFMNKIDVFVFPSYFEGSANSIIEAIHFGKPTIAFDVSTMPELVINDKTGYIVPFQDNKAFAQKMEMFIKNPALIEKIGTSAKEASVQYNLDKVYEEVKKLVGL